MLNKSSEEIGRLLVDEGFVTERQLNRAKAEASAKNESLQKVLVSMGFVSDKDVVQSLGKQIGVEFFDLEAASLSCGR